MKQSLALGTATALITVATSLIAAPAGATAEPRGYESTEILYGPPDEPAYEERTKGLSMPDDAIAIAGLVGLTIATSAAGTYAVATVVDKPRNRNDGTPGM